MTRTPDSVRTKPVYLPPRADRLTARKAMLAFSVRRQRGGSGSDLGHLASRPQHVPSWSDGPVRVIRKAGVPFGVAGGLAANNYMPPRNTLDLDLAVRLADLDAAGRAIAAMGWLYLQPLALYGGLEGTAWKDADGNELDLIGVPGHLGEKTVAEAQGNRLTAGLPTVTLPYLVTLKMIAARAVDTGDLARMLGRADEDAIARTRAVVRRFLPDEMDELEQFILLGRLEYAPAPQATATSSGQTSAPLRTGEVRCRVCGRVLKDDAARRAGVGPDCARKEQRGDAPGSRRAAPRKH